MFRFFLIVSLLVALDLQSQTIDAQDKGGVRIAFGSCSRQQSENQMWQEVIQYKPDVWVWLGDNIYGDTHNMDSLGAMYKRQKSRAGYQALLKTVPAVYGTWDDHDYGVNDGGRYFPKRRESQQKLLDFLDVPAGAEVRKRDGVYQSYQIGNKEVSIKLILLDTRFFRDTLRKSKVKTRRYDINPDGDVLGEAQWQWLERELTDSKAQIHLIASSIQFIAEEQGFEKWANFPAARKRMIELLSRVRPKGVIFLSGDRHIAEFSAMNVPGLKQPIYDFTSSGLTHTWTTAMDEPNSHRVGKLIMDRNFGVLEVRRLKKKITVTMIVYGSGMKELGRHRIII